VDLYPTLVDLAGFAVPFSPPNAAKAPPPPPLVGQELEGLSFRPVLEGRRAGNLVDRKPETEPLDFQAPGRDPWADGAGWKSAVFTQVRVQERAR
jgi:hypothetical protein